MGEFDGVLSRLKDMSASEKEALCLSLRQKIIDTVVKTGGHLASNLGVVELTVGMYSRLDPFKDIIIWDVGHQCYVHKLLTGRDDRFGTLRQLNGISGFPAGSESPADRFDTGHSSTSVSAAVGFARARKLKGGDQRICAVIGDGAFGSGMVYEALNDAGQLGDDIIVILNDNGMSISPNVGAMHKYLIRLRSGRGYIKAKKNVKRALDKLRKVGAFFERRIQRIKGYMRSAVVPEGQLFIELGWKYIGPIDGHDPDAVAEAIDRAEYMGGPVIIHAITEKGRGYAPAEQDPSAYHGVGGSTRSQAEPGPAQRSFSNNLGETLCELADARPEIVAVSAAMVGGTGLSAFAEKYPDRYFDVGIAEEHAVTMSAAMARSGLKPFMCLYSTFSQRAYDQLVHDVALMRNGVVLCLDRAGVSGHDGKTHQGIYDLSFLNPLPGVTVAAPANLREQSEMARLAADSDGPFVLRYPARTSPRELRNESVPGVAVGKGVLVRSPSSDASVILLALGVPVYEALYAAEKLENSGIPSAVYSARFLKPLDRAGITELLARWPHAPVITLEDGVRTGGFGEAVTLIAAEAGLDADRVHVLGFPDEAIPHGAIGELYKLYGLDGDSVAELAAALSGGNAEAAK
ncbi:MAG: 1-deoxy-D-xylulose-5-phosphate synthase [Clostridia bacterium]|nr:1-deoxy-D-xylulose-5-phosphate synthase [Clostridia bacterium]